MCQMVWRIQPRVWLWPLRTVAQMTRGLGRMRKRGLRWGTGGYQLLTYRQKGISQCNQIADAM